MSSYQDIEKTCACGKKFIFTANDQDFYQLQGYAEPKRCRDCRENKKRMQAEKEQHNEEENY